MKQPVINRILSLLVLVALGVCPLPAGADGPCQTSPQDPGDQPASAQYTYTYESTTGALRGKGYNSISMIMTGECVKEGGVTQTVGSTTTNSYFHFVNTTKELEQDLGVNASATTNYGMFSGSVSASVMSQHQVSENTITAVASLEVIGPSATFQNPVMSLASQPADANALFAACGDYYVDTITSGGKLFAVITISNVAQDDHSTIKANLQASVTGIGSGDAGYSSDMSSKLSQYEADVHVYAVGCKSYPLTTGFDEFLSLAQTFHSDIETCLSEKGDAIFQNLASEVTVKTIAGPVTSSYGSNLVPDIQSQQLAHYKLTNMAAQYGELKGTIDYIISHQDEYVWSGPYDTVGALQGLKQDIDDYRQIVNNRLSQCNLNPAACSLPPTSDDGSGGDPSLAASNYPPKLTDQLPQMKNFWPSDCYGVLRKFGSDMPSGNYSLYVNGDQDRMYYAYCCFQDNGSMARTYLNLQHTSQAADSGSSFFTPGFNYSEFINYYQWNVHNWPHLVTTWTKVRLLPMGESLFIDGTDNTFAATKTLPAGSNEVWPFSLGGSPHGLTYAPYGSCVGSWDGRDTYAQTSYPGSANIDLRGTSFKLHSDFATGGYHFSGTRIIHHAQLTDADQVFTAKVGGNNGYATPSSYMIPVLYTGNVE